MSKNIPFHGYSNPKEATVQFDGLILLGAAYFEPEPRKRRELTIGYTGSNWVYILLEYVLGKRIIHPLKT